jgi:hypothetical protein
MQFFLLGRAPQGVVVFAASNIEVSERGEVRIDDNIPQVPHCSLYTWVNSTVFVLVQVLRLFSIIVLFELIGASVPDRIGARFGSARSRDNDSYLLT